MKDIITIYELNELHCGAFGVIGCPIKHSFSPLIHAKLADKEYYKILIKPEDLKIAVSALKRLSGFNVTIPHKIAIIDYLDIIDGAAAEYGAVNTVKITDNGLYGYNTDGYGFVESLNSENITVNGAKVLVLGSGGAARVAATETAKLGARVYVKCRNPDKGYALLKQLNSLYPEAGSLYQDGDTCYDLLVNCTPLGMYPDIDSMPADENMLERVSAVFDMIYNPYETRLIRAAEKMGIKCVNGLYMLIAQAARSREIWTGVSYPDTTLKDIYNKLKAEIRG